tara:strand:- start:168 stop:563 length:396 start_codon:yes stop_codon:yes gene_type:complete
MLKLTKTVEYGLIAITHISQQKEGQLSSAKYISEKYFIPTELLAKILQKLTSLKMLESIKGPKGGYKISADIKNINIFNLIEMLEGPIGIVECTTSSNCQQLETCVIKNPLSKINDKIINTLKNITLDQIR